MLASASLSVQDGYGAADRPSYGQMASTYALSLLALNAVYRCLAGSELSSIVTMAAMLQCVASACLAIQVSGRTAASGVSAKSLGLDAGALCLRLSSTVHLDGYLPVDLTGDWLLQAVDLCTLFIVAWLLYQVLLGERADSYQAAEDSMDVTWLTLGCFVLATLFHADVDNFPLFDIFWMTGLLLGITAALPQLWLITRSGGRAEALISHYVAGMALSRCLSGIFLWHARHDITCQPWIEGFNHAAFAILGAHLLHVLFLGDFLYYYAKAVLKGGLINCALDQGVVEFFGVQ